MSSSIERVETKNSPESSLTRENEGLARNWPGIRGRTDSQGLSSARFRREETIEVVPALSHPARSKGDPHHHRE